MPTPTKDVEGLVESVARIIRGWDLPDPGYRAGPGTRRAIEDADRKAAAILALPALSSEAQTKSLVEREGALEALVGELAPPCCLGCHPICQQSPPKDNPLCCRARSALSAISMGREYKDNSAQSHPCGEGPSDYSVPKSQDNGGRG